VIVRSRMLEKGASRRGLGGWAGKALARQTDENHYYPLLRSYRAKSVRSIQKVPSSFSPDSKSGVTPVVSPHIAGLQKVDRFSPPHADR
jgi:hypothetical protein